MSSKYLPEEVLTLFRGVYKESTVVSKRNVLRRLMRELGSEEYDESLLMDYERVKRAVYGLKKESVRKKTLSDVVMLLKLRRVDEELLLRYKELLEKLQDEENRVMLHRERSSGEKKNWATMEELREMLNDLSEKKGRWIDHRKMVIFAFYVVDVPHRDEIIPSLVLVEEATSEDNTYDPKTGEMVIRKHKTNTKGGSHRTIRYRVSEEMKEILDEFVERNRKAGSFVSLSGGSKWLVPSSKGGQSGKKDIYNTLNSITSKYGKKITTTLFRTIHASRSDLTFEEHRELSKKMDHSLGRHFFTYRRVNGDKELPYELSNIVRKFAKEPEKRKPTIKPRIKPRFEVSDWRKPSSKASSKPSVRGSGKCRGMTLKGTPCSRNGKYDGYCKSHIPK